MDRRPGRYLIVNGDDFGAGAGVNRGIIEAHRSGVLTSTSLMVNGPASEAAAAGAASLPDLDIGLHVQLTADGGSPRVAFSDPRRVRRELVAQYTRFEELLGRPPTHLDSHRNVHRDPRLRPLFLEFARERELPLRGCGPVRCLSRFYGQWDGVPHLEQVGVESLIRMLREDVEDGISELACHPGHPDPDLRSSYTTERWHELRTLCDPRVPLALAEEKIERITFRELSG